MGEVFLALDPRLRREVALKILPPEVSSDAGRSARFEREARLTSQLNHPNIVAVYDFVHDHGVSGLVMELVRGETLREALGRGPLPVRKAVAIASAIARALAAAHGVGVVHRDLKPENVMLTREGVVKVLDFGLAREVAPLVTNSGSNTAVHLSQPGQVVGTAIYMSPEQASGEAVDFRSDQFSLGLVLYEMLAGKHPFRRGTVTSTVAALIIEEPAPSVDQISPDLPGSVARVMRRCLRKEPRERYGSTLDLAHDLGEAAEELERPAAPGVEVRRRGWRAALPWALAALALLAAAAAYVTRAGGGDVRQGSVSVEAAIDLRDLKLLSAEISRNLALSPDGRYLLLEAIDGAGLTPIRIQDLQTGELRTLEGTRAALSFAWSPDSRSIAYFEGGKLKRIGLDGTPPVVLCDANPEGMPTWAGETILFPRYTPPAGIYRVSASGGTPQAVIGGDPDLLVAAFWPRFLPDGRHFLYLHLWRDPATNVFSHSLRAASIDGGDLTEVANISSNVEYASGHLLYVREGSLLAQPFDTKRMRLHGEARPIARNVNYFYNTGGASFSAADNGVLAWRVARQPAPMHWVTRGGAIFDRIEPQIFEWPRISPDGVRIAVGVVNPQNGTSDVWSYTLATGAIEKVTFDLRDERHPVWAPDGAGLYYRSDGNGPPDVVYRRIGDPESKSVVARPGVQEPRDVSPDGRLLIFHEYSPGTGSDLWVMPMDGSGEARPLVRTPFRDWDARFSPDGKSIAYQSDVSGRPEIYLRALDGGARPLMVSTGGGTMPRWRADGRELFYYSLKEMITSVAVGADGSVEPQRSTPLFHAEISTFEPAPDGTRFLIVPAEDTRVPVRVLTNWTARLQQR
jgi:eukaryotic-like serine/threonine-protein kinase